MMQHFFENNANSLCCNRENIRSRIAALSSHDLKDIQNLGTVAKYIKELPKAEQESLQHGEFKVRCSYEGSYQKISIQFEMFNIYIGESFYLSSASLLFFSVKHGYG